MEARLVRVAEPGAAGHCQHLKRDTDIKDPLSFKATKMTSPVRA